MNEELVIEILETEFPLNVEIQVPKLRGGNFTVVRNNEGIVVSNLGNNPFLPWLVFTTTINLLNELGGVVLKGNGISGKLGTTITPTNSIEGRVASVVYNKVEGSYVFRRITPIVGMLIYAGICQNTGRYLSFLPQFMPHEN